MLSTAQKIASNTFYTSMSGIGIRVFSLVGYFLIIAKLSVFDFGIVALLFTALGPSSAIVFLGLDKIFISEVARSCGEKRYRRALKLIQDFCLLVLILSSLLILGTFLFKNIIGQYFDFLFFQYYWLVVIFVLSQFVLNVALLILGSHEDFKSISKLEYLESFCRVLLIAIFWGQLSIGTVVLAYALAKFIVAFLAIPKVFKIIKNLLNLSRTQTENRVLYGIIKKFAKWEILTNFLNQSVAPFRLWVIKIFINVESVAYYDFAENIYGLFVSLVPLRKVVFPAISRNIHNPALVRMIIMKARKYLLLFYMVLSLIVLIFTPVFVQTFFPAYSQSIFLVYLHSIRLFLDVFSLGQSSLIYAFRKLKFRFAMEILSIILLVFYYITFVKTLGLIGGVIGGELLIITMVIIKEWYLERKLKFKTWRFAEFLRYDKYDQMIIQLIKNSFLKFFRAVKV
ncbi:oligosaccharide flippase family protein [Patescibacteria group bacterium]|nr:oligosaccharide flippase family protein [Patescibacteria group bacterium]